VTTNAGRAPPIPAGVGSDGASFRGLDAAGAPVTVLRLMPGDDEVVNARRRRLTPLAESAVDGALAVRRVDVKAGVVVLERPTRNLAEALESAPFTTELHA
jgi:hypothetical protein